MSTLFQKSNELSADAKLSTKVGPAGLAALKSTGLSSTTTLMANTFFSDNWKKISSSFKSTNCWILLTFTSFDIDIFKNKSLFFNL